MFSTYSSYLHAMCNIIKNTPEEDVDLLIKLVKIRSYTWE